MILAVMEDFEAYGQLRDRPRDTPPPGAPPPVLAPPPPPPPPPRR